MSAGTGEQRAGTGRRVAAVVAWLWVLLPFLWGVWQLLIKVVPLFGG